MPSDQHNSIITLCVTVKSVDTKVARNYYYYYFIIIIIIHKQTKLQYQFTVQYENIR